MGILFFLALGFLVYTNARLASSKGRNPIAWVLISLAAYFISYAVLATIYLSIIYKGAPTQDAIMDYFQKNPTTALFVIMLGLSGVLGVRYYLEKSQSRKR